MIFAQNNILGCQESVWQTPIEFLPRSTCWSRQWVGTWRCFATISFLIDKFIFSSSNPEHSELIMNLIKLKGTAKLTAQGERVCLKDSKFVLFEILENRTWKGCTSSCWPSKPDLVIWLARLAGARNFIRKAILKSECPSKNPQFFPNSYETWMITSSSEYFPQFSSGLGKNCGFLLGHSDFKTAFLIKLRH